MATAQADFTRVPDYSIVDPRRNWYQVSIAGSDRPLYAEESPTNIVRRLQSQNGLTPADGVIRDNVLALVERLVNEGARRAPSDSAEIYVATIADDRRHFRTHRSGPISEGTWKAIIWASREDLRNSPQALFDGAIRLDAFRSTDEIRMPLFGVDLPVAFAEPSSQHKPHSDPHPEPHPEPQPEPQPELQPVPPEAGDRALPGGTTDAIAIRGVPSVATFWERAKPYAPAIAVGVVGIAGIAILWSLMKKEERYSQRPYGHSAERL
jgi:hypothetical protein